MYSTGNEKPTTRDVCRHVVPSYAHKWRFLGVELQFDQAELDIIFSNHHNDSVSCCRDLMSGWLQKFPSATWDQLLTAIDNLPEFTCTSDVEGTILLSIVMCSTKGQEKLHLLYKSCCTLAK